LFNFLIGCKLETHVEFNNLIKLIDWEVKGLILQNEKFNVGDFL
jgi:hypothetical protein